MRWSNLLERRWFPLLLIAVWALAYLPNLGARPLRLEEGRRATPAREMLASGDFVRPTLYGDTYLNKPPLYFWLIATAGEALGEVDPLATRLPSVLAALGCALIALRFARKDLDRRTRSLAALFVLSSATLLDKGTLGEIDATLCLLVVASLSCWWAGNRSEGQSSGSWLGLGLLLGLAGLLKGPAGPALFYLTVGPYLIWQRRWRQLFTLGHVGCVALAILPSAAWVLALLERGVVTLPDLLTVWEHQVGANEAANSFADPSGHLAQIARHYSEFPLQVVLMLLPGVLWLPFGLRRSWCAKRELPEELRRFLLCGTIVPVVAFFLYPESRPRHLMPAFFPACILAAMVVGGMVRQSHWGFWQARAALLLALGPSVLAIIGGAFAVSVNVIILPLMIVAVAIGTVSSTLAVRLTLKTGEADGPLALAATASSWMLAAWFVVNTLVVPWQASHGPEAAAVAIGKQIPPAETLYTTRTFPRTGEGYYNVQFHLAREVRAADLETLKRTAPCYAGVTRDERAQLEADGFLIDELGRIERAGLPELQVVRLTRTSTEP